MSQWPDTDANPYASPRHTSGTLAPVEPERPRFHILAVIVGWLVDIVSSTVAGLLLGVVLGIVLVAQGANLEQMQQVLSNSIGVLLGGLFIGTCGSILGGYVAAWMAKQWELRHAMAAGLLSLLSGIALILLQSLSPVPLAQTNRFTVIGFVLTVPAAVFGGWLRRMVAANRK